MIAVKINLNDGRSFFISEHSCGIKLVNNIQDAFIYENTLEFKVSWEIGDINRMYGCHDFNLSKKNVVSFIAINTNTLKKHIFNVDKQEIRIGKKITVDSKTFHSLKGSWIQNSHILYDKEGNTIYQNIENYNYENVHKIVYKNGALTAIISNTENWFDRYDGYRISKIYRRQYKCMLNPIIQQIYLLHLDWDYKFTIYENG